jgi:hypothetical protein
MHRVRYYNKLIEPYYFKRGIRGFWIRVLNRVRLWVEGRVAYHVMRYLADEDGLTRAQRKPFAATFRKDLKEEVAKCKNPDPVPSSILDDGTVIVQHGRKRHELGARLRTERFLARVIQDSRRKRYIRRDGLVGDPEGDFEPVSDDAAATVEVTYGRGQQATKTRATSAREVRRNGG